MDHLDVIVSLHLIASNTFQNNDEIGKGFSATSGQMTLTSGSYDLPIKLTGSWGCFCRKLGRNHSIDLSSFCYIVEKTEQLCNQDPGISYNE